MARDSSSQNLERSRVDLLTHPRVLDQRVIDIPEDQAGHSITVASAKTSFGVLDIAQYVPCTNGVNERLRSTMLRRGFTPSKLAKTCDVNTKTVERWINSSRVPHRETR